MDLYNLRHYPDLDDNGEEQYKAAILNRDRIFSLDNFRVFWPIEGETNCERKGQFAFEAEEHIMNL